MFRELLTERLQGIFSPSAEQLDRLESHYQILTRWNKVLNLTSLRRTAEIVERHYCESIFLAVYLPARTLSVVDIGSGAGFPGVAVAAIRPDCQVALVESHRRKAVFLKEATRSWRNVNVLPIRAEDMTGTYDWAVSRAVSWLELAPLLKRSARCAALLTTGENLQSLDGFQWEGPIRLPWGSRRVLLLGRNISGGFT